MSNLYEISSKYENILLGYLSYVEETAINDGLYSFDDVIDKIDDEFNEKVINLCSFIKNIEADINSIDVVLDKLKFRKKKLEAAKDDVIECVKSSMEKLNFDKVHHSLFDVKIAKNPAKLVISDESLIPQDYITTKLVEEIDKKKIKEDLKNMVEVSGAELQSSTRLVIK